MGKDSNNQKYDYLGLNFSTAQNRLKKLILFKLVQETSKDICFKCNERIDSEDELSIEHKEPWLHVDKDLFWNIENIAFSHLKCNKPDRPRGWNLSKDIYLCSICQKHLPIDKFSKNSSKIRGVQSHCKDCHRSWRNRKTMGS